MIVWMAGVVALSIILIFLVHEIYDYFKKSFSKPLERNIVNETKTHYEQIYNTLSSNRQPEMPIPVPLPLPSEVYKKPETNNMADELMNFMSDIDNIVEQPTEVDIQPYDQELDGISTF
jgi:hypothetical protein